MSHAPRRLGTGLLLAAGMAVACGGCAAAEGSDVASDCSTLTDENVTGYFSSTTMSTTCADGTCTETCRACHNPSGTCISDVVDCPASCVMPTVEAPRADVLAEGDVCGGGWYTCVDGLECRPLSADDPYTSVCQGPAGTGDPCGQDDQCPAGHACQQSEHDVDPLDWCSTSFDQVCTCIDRSGRACDWSGECGHESRCTNHVCTELGEEGDSCSSWEDSPECADGLECRSRADGGGACVDPARARDEKIGAACSDAVGCDGLVCELSVLGSKCTRACSDHEPCPEAWSCGSTALLVDPHCVPAASCPVGYEGHDVLLFAMDDGFGEPRPTTRLSMSVVLGTAAECYTAVLATAEAPEESLGTVSGPMLVDGTLRFVVADFPIGPIPPLLPDGGTATLRFSAASHTADSWCGTVFVDVAGDFALSYQGTFAVVRAGAEEPATPTCP